MNHDDYVRFITEDAPSGDVTSDVFINDVQCEGYGIAKEDFYVAGLEEIRDFYKFLNVELKTLLYDGMHVVNGDILFTVKGNIKNVLKGERVSLNILQRMSGIATKTRRFVDIVRPVNDKVIIAATRKTTPGFRYYEKRAVEIGSGWTHRLNLSDAILIKDNHIATAGINKICEINRNYKTELTKEIEVTTMDELKRIISEPFDIIMLDNFSVEMARESYSYIRRIAPDKKIEISGGITEENIALYAPFADIISVGALTHSYRSVDISMEIKGVRI